MGSLGLTPYSVSKNKFTPTYTDLCHGRPPDARRATWGEPLPIQWAIHNATRYWNTFRPGTVPWSISPLYSKPSHSTPGVTWKRVRNGWTYNYGAGLWTPSWRYWPISNGVEVVPLVTFSGVGIAADGFTVTVAGFGTVYDLPSSFFLRYGDQLGQAGAFNGYEGGEIAVSLSALTIEDFDPDNPPVDPEISGPDPDTYFKDERSFGEHGSKGLIGWSGHLYSNYGGGYPSQVQFTASNQYAQQYPNPPVFVIGSVSVAGRNRYNCYVEERDTARLAAYSASVRYYSDNTYDIEVLTQPVVGVTGISIVDISDRPMFVPTHERQDRYWPVIVYISKSKEFSFTIQSNQANGPDFRYRFTKSVSDRSSRSSSNTVIQYTTETEIPMSVDHDGPYTLEVEDRNPWGWWSAKTAMTVLVAERNPVVMSLYMLRPWYHLIYLGDEATYYSYSSEENTVAWQVIGAGEGDGVFCGMMVAKRLSLAARYYDIALSYDGEWGREIDSELIDYYLLARTLDTTGISTSYYPNPTRRAEEVSSMIGSISHSSGEIDGGQLYKKVGGEWVKIDGSLVFEIDSLFTDVQSVSSQITGEYIQKFTLNSSGIPERLRVHSGDTETLSNQYFDKVYEFEIWTGFPGAEESKRLVRIRRGLGDDEQTPTGDGWMDIPIKETTDTVFYWPRPVENGKTYTLVLREKINGSFEGCDQRPQIHTIRYSANPLSPRTPNDMHFIDKAMSCSVSFNSSTHVGTGSVPITVDPYDGKNAYVDMTGITDYSLITKDTSGMRLSNPWEFYVSSITLARSWNRENQLITLTYRFEDDSPVVGYQSYYLDRYPTLQGTSFDGWSRFETTDEAGKLTIEMLSVYNIIWHVNLSNQTANFSEEPVTQILSNEEDVAANHLTGLVTMPDSGISCIGLRSPDGVGHGFMLLTNFADCPTSNPNMLSVNEHLRDKVFPVPYSRPEMSVYPAPGVAGQVINTGYYLPDVLYYDTDHWDGLGDPPLAQVYIIRSLDFYDGPKRAKLEKMRTTYGCGLYFKFENNYSHGTIIGGTGYVDDDRVIFPCLANGIAIYKLDPDGQAHLMNVHYDWTFVDDYVQGVRFHSTDKSIVFGRKFISLLDISTEWAVTADRAIYPKADVIDIDLLASAIGYTDEQGCAYFVDRETFTELDIEYAHDEKAYTAIDARDNMVCACATDGRLYVYEDNGSLDLQRAIDLTIGRLTQFELTAGYAVASGTAVNIVNPTAGVILSTLAGTTFFIDDPYCYTAVGNKIFKYDLTDTGNPSLVYEYTHSLSLSIRRIVKVGSNLICTSLNNSTQAGVYSLEIENPGVGETLEERGSTTWELEKQATRLTSLISGQSVYVAFFKDEHPSDSVHAVLISSPNNPQYSGRSAIKYHGDPVNFGLFYSFASSGSLYFPISASEDGLDSVYPELSIKSGALSDLSQHDLPYKTRVSCISVRNNKVYMGTKTQDGIWIKDLSTGLFTYGVYWTGCKRSENRAKNVVGLDDYFMVFGTRVCDIYQRTAYGMRWVNGSWIPLWREGGDYTKRRQPILNNWRGSKLYAGGTAATVTAYYLRNRSSEYDNMLIPFDLSLAEYVINHAPIVDWHASVLMDSSASLFTSPWTGGGTYMYNIKQRDPLLIGDELFTVAGTSSASGMIKWDVSNPLLPTFQWHKTLTHVGGVLYKDCIFFATDGTDTYAIGGNPYGGETLNTYSLCSVDMEAAQFTTIETKGPEQEDYIQAMVAPFYLGTVATDPVKVSPTNWSFSGNVVTITNSQPNKTWLMYSPHTGTTAAISTDGSGNGSANFDSATVYFFGYYQMKYLTWKNGVPEKLKYLTPPDGAEIIATFGTDGYPLAWIKDGANHPEPDPDLIQGYSKFEFPSDYEGNIVVDHFNMGDYADLSNYPQYGYGMSFLQYAGGQGIMLKPVI